MRFLDLAILLGSAAFQYIVSVRATRKTKARYDEEGTVSAGRSATQRSVLLLERLMRWGGIATAVAAVALFPIPMDDSLYFLIAFIPGILALFGASILTIDPPRGNQTCPGNPPTPFEFDFPGPLGDRELLTAPSCRRRRRVRGVSRSDWAAWSEPSITGERR